MSEITITLNGEKKTLSHKMSLSELISELELDIKKIAVEKDLEIIFCENFSEIILDEGSKVEIVHFIGGG